MVVMCGVEDCSSCRNQDPGQTPTNMVYCRSMSEIWVDLPIAGCALLLVHAIPT